jgi:hypothetical protein
MANWYGVLRSNYFQVKDYGAFVDWLKGFQLEMLTDDEGVGFASTGEGYVPTSKADPDYDEDGVEIDVDFFEELATHLAEGSVCIVMQSGHEKLRYITGEAWLITSDGPQEAVSLGDIYAIAAEKFPTKTCTYAEY